MPDWIFKQTASHVMLLAILVFVGGTWLGVLLIRPILRFFALKQADSERPRQCRAVMLRRVLRPASRLAGRGRVSKPDRRRKTCLWRGTRACRCLWRDFIDVYPATLAAELQGDLKKYCLVTIEKDWPQQQKGKMPMAGSAAIRSFLKRLRAFEPKTERESTLHKMVIDTVEKARDLRRERVYSVGVGLPGILWYVVLIGAMINIGFIYLFDLRFLNVLLLGGLLSFFIATVIGLIVVMDRPLSGPSSVPPDAFVTLYECGHGWSWQVNGPTSGKRTLSWPNSKVHQLEGTTYVDAILENEAIPPRPALPVLHDRRHHDHIPAHSPARQRNSGDANRRVESHRPVYRGTGTITLESSLGGFHVLDLDNETWVLERRQIWASEMSIDVGSKRESVLTSIWAGEGLIFFFQTKVSGTGKVVLATRGPIEVIELEKGKKVVAEGQYVVARHTPGSR